MLIQPLPAFEIIVLQFRRLDGVAREPHGVAALEHFKAGVVDVELGVGYGFTGGSDRLVAKAILGYAFPVPGKGSDGNTAPKLGMGTAARSTQDAWNTR